MLPDDAVARIVEGAQSIGKICQSKGIGEWEVVAFQSYGHEFQSIGNEIKIYLLDDETADMVYEYWMVGDLDMPI